MVEGQQPKKIDCGRILGLKVKRQMKKRRIIQPKLWTEQPYVQNSQLVQSWGLVHSGRYEVGRTRYMWMGSTYATTYATTMVSYGMGLQ